MHITKFKHSDILPSSCLFSLSCNNNCINYRLQERWSKEVCWGLSFLVSLLWSSMSWSETRFMGDLNSTPCSHTCCTSRDIVELHQATADQRLMDKGKTIFTLKWFAGIRQSPKQEAKQFITQIAVLFLEAHRVSLCAWNTLQWVWSAW